MQLVPGLIAYVTAKTYDVPVTAKKQSVQPLLLALQAVLSEMLR